jgi:hypothetical protein
VKLHNLKLGRNNEPILRFRARIRAANPVYDVSGKGFALYVKVSNDDDDVDAIAVYTNANGGITVPDPTAGEILVQVTNAATAEAGSFFYHFDMIEGTRPVTVLYGEWLVRGV